MGRCPSHCDPDGSHQPPAHRHDPRGCGVGRCSALRRRPSEAGRCSDPTP
ncbi:hypothetical protein F4560_001917 [Saccharothrix ecbatanensis]|uniref:Uncharacterized protein n=1 Tax=Saccharothrix ecbatanensis TaxID=1105145 RepID=A0A7W9HHW5_9PSEU|nr:hypothetical protein [Saccharothrix ecbatanensis]